MKNKIRLIKKIKLKYLNAPLHIHNASNRLSLEFPQDSKS